MNIVMMLLMLPLVCLALLAVIFLIPFFNRGFSLIWSDPSERQRKEALARLNELYVDGQVPEEVAVLLASKERNATEEELMNLVGMVGTSDMKAVLTGKKTLLGVMLNEIESVVKKNTKRRKG